MEVACLPENGGLWSLLGILSCELALSTTTWAACCWFLYKYKWPMVDKNNVSTIVMDCVNCKTTSSMLSVAMSAPNGRSTFQQFNDVIVGLWGLAIMCVTAFTITHDTLFIVSFKQLWVLSVLDAKCLIQWSFYWKFIFLQRYAERCISYNKLCLSICLSRSGIVSK